MNSLRRVIAAAVLAAAAGPVAVGQSPRQSKNLSADEILNAKVTDCYTQVSYEDEETHEYLDECVNIRKVTVQSLLADAFFGSYAYDIPAGFVPADFGDARDRRDFTPAGMSVRDLLDSIVAADPRYKWGVEDGVVNLLPAAGSPPLLDVRLAEFKSKGHVNKLFRDLEENPEVRRRAAELGFHTGQPSGDGNGFIISLWANQPVHEIHCRDCTVLEALNEIARRVRGCSWAYRESQNRGNKYFHFTSIFAPL